MFIGTFVLLFIQENAHEIYNILITYPIYICVYVLPSLPPIMIWKEYDISV